LIFFIYFLQERDVFIHCYISLVLNFSCSYSVGLGYPLHLWIIWTVWPVSFIYHHKCAKGNRL